MLKFEWCDEYVVDGGQIDHEHRSLIRMANDVFSVGEPQEHRDRIIGLVKELYQYMETHFENEEDIMRECNYPRYPEHMAKHREILAEMNRAIRDIRGLDRYIENLQDMMVHWVIRHIAQDDALIGEHLQHEAH